MHLSLINEIDSNIFVGKKNLEQHCTEGCVGTFNSTEMDRKTTTYGGIQLVDDSYSHIESLTVNVLYSFKYF